MTNNLELAVPLQEYLEDILRVLPDAVTVIDGSGRYIFANEMAAQMCGYDSVEELLVTTPAETLVWLEVTGEDGRSLSPDDVLGRRAMCDGLDAASFLVHYRAVRTGEEYWTRLRVTRLRTNERDGHLDLQVFHDVTEAIRSQQALAFLNEASTLLARSIDYDTTLKSLAQLAVPRIADWCSIEMIEPDGSVRTLAVAHVDPAMVAIAWELTRKYPFNPNATAGLAEVLRTGKPQILAEITDEMLTSGPQDPEFLHIVRSLGLKSTMWVPLNGRQGTLGAITLVSAESGHRYNEQDLALADDLAARAAIAVDNANLYSEAQRSGAELRSVLGQMSDAVMVANTEGIVTFANEAASQFFGQIVIGAPVAGSRPEAKMMTMDGESLEPDQMVLKRAVAGETFAGFLWRVMLPGAKERVLETSAVPLHGADGALLGAVTVSRDITYQHDFDRQKDAFLLSASHDLKNPLTLVKGIAQLLEQRMVKEGIDDEQLTGGLHRISSTATRMSEMVNELLDVTRIQMNRPLVLESRRVNLVAMVERIADEVRSSSERNPIEVHIDSSPPDGWWDGLRIERAIVNLVINAGKFSYAGTTIHIRVWTEVADSRTWACLSVSDQGVGIPAKDIPHIFEQFRRGENVTGRIAGGGIGLAGAKQIIEQHGGSIHAESTENKGSVFAIKLPTGERRSKPRESKS